MRLFFHSTLLITPTNLNLILTSKYSSSTWLNSSANVGFVSVEAIASENLIDVQFKSLRESIHALQRASAALDEEKHKVAKDLRKAIKNLKKHKKVLKKVYCRIKKLFGRKCSCPHKEKSPMSIGDQEESSMILGLAVHAGYKARSNLLPHPGKAIKYLKKLSKRIQAVNAKSSAFERGFISVEGIKDREWYKHLAVAPEKWLGSYNFLSFLFCLLLNWTVFVFRLWCYHNARLNRGNHVWEKFNSGARWGY